MAINNLLETSTESFSDIVSNGKRYRVPLFQRDYSWDKDNWEDLWSDIVNPDADKSAHYMGSIVLQNQGNKRYTIIDGQQRFATLSLLALAIIKKLNDFVEADVERENNAERVKILKSKFIGDKDPASLTYSSKLELNENNDSFFQTYLLPFRQPLNINTLNVSDRRLWDGYQFFCETVGAFFKKENNGENIANFLNKTIAERLTFIQIIVENELSAYTVFETLNSRGVGLTITDLLKNYLFSLATKNDLQHIRKQWERIIQTLGLDRFPVFLRHYWISKRRLIRQEKLFKTIRSSIVDSRSVFDFLEDIQDNADLYLALSDPSDSLWAGDQEMKQRIRALRFFNVKQCLPILLIAFNKLNSEEFKKVLRIILVISFRYTVIGRLPTNQMEETYNKASTEIATSKITHAADIARKLKSIYPSDRDFQSLFSTKAMHTVRHKKQVRYILFELENHRAQSDRDFEFDGATIEHILPENPDQLWSESFPENTQEMFLYRLGNYTLLEADKNRDCGASDFIQKKNVYTTSQYALTKSINHDDWTPMSLEHRQAQMAKEATAIWRLPYFD